MSRQMNLPQISKILQEFEKESSMMDLKGEMMSDAIDDVMEDEGGEGTEEAEGDRILEEVLAEIGISVGQQVRIFPWSFSSHALSRAVTHVNWNDDSWEMLRQLRHLRRYPNQGERRPYRWEKVALHHRLAVVERSMISKRD